MPGEMSSMSQDLVVCFTLVETKTQVVERLLEDLLGWNADHSEGRGPRIVSPL